jgi:hypothetical protein
LRDTPTSSFDALVDSSHRCLSAALDVCMRASERDTWEGNSRKSFRERSTEYACIGGMTKFGEISIASLPNARSGEISPLRPSGSYWQSVKSTKERRDRLFTFPHPTWQGFPCVQIDRMGCLLLRVSSGLESCKWPHEYVVVDALVTCKRPGRPHCTVAALEPR